MMRDNSFALSMVQQDIYFDQLHYPDSPLYNIGGYIDLPTIDIERLRQAHRQVVSNHDAFGIRIITSEQGVEQYISEQRNLSLPLLDMSNHKDPEAAATEWLQAHFQDAFAVDENELFRATLIKLSVERWFYVGMAHHVCLDGWGFANWAQRLGQYYAKSEAEMPSKPWLEVVSKEAEYTSSARYQKDKAYWQEQLNVLPEPFLTPFYHQDFPESTAVPSRRQILPISAARHKHMQHRATELGVGVAQLYQVWIALYFALAHELPELVLGTPVHNRKDKRDKVTLGAFLSVIPVRLNMATDQTLKQLCEQVAGRMRQNFRHQRFGVGDMRRDILGGAEQRALFEVGYNYLKLDSDLDIDGQPANLVYLSHNHEQTPVMMTVWEYGEGQGVQLQIDHNLAFFSEQDVHNMIQRLDYLLDQLQCKDNKVIQEYKILSAKERARVLANTEGEHLPYSSSLLPHQLFVKQAQLQPDALAIDADIQLTYGQLDHLSNQVAHKLIDRGLQPGSFVGIHCPRRAVMLISLLGSLKAGLTFIALDPNYPESRIQYIIENSGIELVLSHSSCNRKLKGVATITVDQLLDETNNSAVSSVEMPVSAESLAYCIYTSGSTGNPKGVMIRQRNLLSLLHWARSEYSNQQLRRVLACTSLNFDLSMFELFVPLAFGTTVVLVEDALALIESELDITLLNTVPSAAKSLLQHNAIPPSVNTVNLAGEPLSASVVNALLETSCNTVYNLYGPSEDTTYSTWSRFDKKLERQPDIGKPLANTQAYVLSPSGKLLPHGYIGELYLAGDGISAGYLNRPDLTKERFIELPFARGPVYRTGDLVRYQNDGTLTYIGRTDDQVKLRGFRIELGEIEHVLSNHPDVQDAVVLVIGENLLAFVVGDKSIMQSLKQNAQKLLPSFMVPARFVFIDELPLTPNGKVNKKMLRALSDTEDNRVVVKPSNDMERAIASLTAQILQLDGTLISMDYSFFELGGHSLSAVKLTAALKCSFDVSLSIRHVFEAISLRDLANTIRGCQDKQSMEPQIGSLSHPEQIPLSATQRRLWLIDRVQGHSRDYHMPFALHITSGLDIQALQQALHKIITRHHVLRTCYVEQSEEVYQQLLSVDELLVEIVDMTGHAVTGQTVETQIRNFCEQDFDLQSQLPIRAAWLSLSNNEGVLLFNVHHIAFDGWSVGIFLDELIALYKNNVAALPELTVQYADYALWQEKMLQGTNLQKEIDFWKKQLSDAPLRHSLPIKQHHASTDRICNSVHMKVDKTQLNALYSTASHHKLTLFNLLHAAIALVLSRNSGCEDIVIGTAATNRNLTEIQSMIGFCVNTLALRVNTACTSIQDYFAHVRQIDLTAFEHQSVPFDTIIDACDIPRNKAYTPVFQIMFTLNDASAEQAFVERLGAKRLDIPVQYCKFEIEIDAQLSGDELTFDWRYDSNLYDAEWIENLCDQLARVLMQLAENNTDNMADLQVLSNQEQEFLVHTLNDNALSYPKSATLTSLFEQQAKLKPESIAVLCDSGSWSYRQLNNMANIIAYKLLEQKVAPHERVGISSRRDISMIAAMLGILKVGAAYVPIDPEYPLARRNYIVEDSGIRLLLGQQDICHDLDVEQILDLDLVFGSLSHDLQNPQGLAQANSIAYLIYTSGSTGKPKGVQICHQNAVAMLHWADDYYSDEELAKTLASTSISFDLSVFELFLPLCFGHQCVLVDNIMSLLTQHQEVTLINTVPSAMRLLIEQQALPSSTKVVNLAGEALKASLVNQVLAAGVDRLCNLYGPSEDTTYSTCAEFTEPLDGIPPIGHVINNSQAYVMSQSGHLLPFGAAGELCLGGDGVAKGYLNKAEMTAERFIPNPFGEGLLYRTGDLVSYCSKQGDLAYLGRMDDQVKIRGFRIELGEVEKTIKINGVKDVCALAVGDEQDRRLVAFVVFEKQAKLNELEQLDTLKARIASELPEHMRPSQLVVVETLPLTPNGKIDKKKLEKHQFTLDLQKVVAPQTKLEQSLLHIWLQRLPEHSVSFGVTDNFFELGGHSLLAVRICGDIRSQLLVPCSVKDLFEHPTIQQLANFLGHQQQQLEVNPLVASERNDKYYPLSFAQRRIWFLSQLENSGSEFNMATALRVRGCFNVAQAELAFKCIVERHESLRSRFVMINGQPKVSLVDTVDICIKQHDLSCLSGLEQIKALLEQKSAHQAYQFDIANEQLIRIDHIQLTQGDNPESVLLFNIHHLIADGWSVAILMREFMAHYDAISSHDKAALPQLHVQYIDWTRWQQQRFAGDYLSQALNYWSDLLNNAPSTHSLPLDNKRGSSSAIGGLTEQHLDITLCESIKAQLQETNTTVFMYLQAAFALLVGRVSREPDVVMGAPVAGREQPQTADLIGLFLNTQVFRSEFSDNPSWYEMLKRTREQHLTSGDYSDLPFELLVEKINPARNIHQSPIFQLFINYDNTEQVDLKLRECSFITEQADEMTNKYDITLYIKGNVNEGISLTWSYNRALFDNQTIEFYSQEFEFLIRQLCTNPLKPVLTHTWQNSRSWDEVAVEVSTPEHYQFYHLIRHHAENHGEHAALSFGNSTLNYAELVTQVEQMAACFATRGLKAGQAAAIYCNRDERRIIAILAVLKLGCAYVPLSQELPINRLQFMLDDSAATMLISDSISIKQGLNPSQQCQVLLLDDAQTQMEMRHAKPVATAEVTANSIAHIIFTSGSTGNPKGVAGTYHATFNRIEWMVKDYPLELGERCAHVTSMAFIRGVWELLVPLCGGGHLVLCERETVKNVSKLWQWMVTNHISRIVTAPSLMKALSDLSKSQTEQLMLTHWCVSGEPLLQIHADEVLERFPNTRLFNLYGSTETMSDVSFKEVSSNNDYNDWVPVGKAISNTAIFTIGLDGEPLPRNVIGEIAVAGAALANGYISAEDANAAFALSTIGRVYKTGDLGILTSNDEIICLGRADDQIKIRGYRIELGEVTTSIAQLPFIKTCVVRPFGEPNEQKLVAYMIAETDCSLSKPRIIEAVKQTLRNELPSYMAPSFYMVLDELPLRPNGKVDRQALPIPDLKQQQLNYVAAETESETKVAAIWAELLALDVKNIGVTTNFFELGGHSLLVTQLMQILHEQFEVNLGYEEFFNNNTIRYIAERIDNTTRVKDVLDKNSNKSSKLFI
ncbi:non-ribosomal peptide synthetase [Pseudoalteromonas sp. OANN1]|uniref:non-ribosomal peptide synthetase n=1 Tax=Pseudoalteromonas sp. OANN1 TaxID=2954497 RepID=UPI00209768AE|nr:non-ribosomal peptide synthetase [Pseudoalteromonas sp. OANN1]MCO7199082.1 amino acid adenylation domain-containing protein [Pseudoalteromonas sp. OANN1]